MARRRLGRAPGGEGRPLRPLRWRRARASIRVSSLRLLRQAVARAAAGAARMEGRRRGRGGSPLRRQRRGWRVAPRRRRHRCADHRLVQAGSRRRERRLHGAADGGRANLALVLLLEHGQRRHAHEAAARARTRRGGQLRLQLRLRLRPYVPAHRVGHPLPERAAGRRAPLTVRGRARRAPSSLPAAAAEHVANRRARSAGRAAMPPRAPGAGAARPLPLPHPTKPSRPGAPPPRASPRLLSPGARLAGARAGCAAPPPVACCARRVAKHPQAVVCVCAWGGALRSAISRAAPAQPRLRARAFFVSLFARARTHSDLPTPPRCRFCRAAPRPRAGQRKGTRALAGDRGRPLSRIWICARAGGRGGAPNLASDPAFVPEADGCLFARVWSAGAPRARRAASVSHSLAYLILMNALFD